MKITEKELRSLVREALIAQRHMTKDQYKKDLANKAARTAALIKQIGVALTQMGDLAGVNGDFKTQGEMRDMYKISQDLVDLLQNG